MTTIILTIIGILLAAAAALMVIFYGGDAFNSGSTGATANTIQNAGTNVISAIQLYKIERGSVTGATLTALKASNCTIGGACLKEDPSIPVSDPGGALPVQSVAGRQYIVDNVGRDVCAKINANLKVSLAAASSSTATMKMGCSMSATGTSLGIFFANA